MPSISLEVDPALWFLLRPRRRIPRFEVDVPPTDTLGHVIRMIGIPPTEAGRLTFDGETVVPAFRPSTARPAAGGGPGGGVRTGVPPVLTVAARARPQPTRHRPPRFLLDVHLGSLARRLRILGIDTAYERDAADADLVDRSVREARVLLTRDRGLLHRAALLEGALVRGNEVEHQLADVLDRFVPPLAPSTLCPLCGAALVPVGASEVAGELPEHTRAGFRDFSRCSGCAKVYWHGAHFRRLDAVIDDARRRTGPGRG